MPLVQLSTKVFVACSCTSYYPEARPHHLARVVEEVVVELCSCSCESVHQLVHEPWIPLFCLPMFSMATCFSRLWSHFHYRQFSFPIFYYCCVCLLSVLAFIAFPFACSFLPRALSPDNFNKMVLCARCDKTVYFNEEKKAIGKSFHVSCFVCGKWHLFLLLSVHWPLSIKQFK